MKKTKVNVSKLQFRKVNISVLTNEQQQGAQGGTAMTIAGPTWTSLVALSTICPPPDPGNTGCVDCGVCPRF